VTADVDVVIPVRNGGRLLADAVDSVLDQHDVHVNVVVVDDGSTDGAVGRLKRDPRITILTGPHAGIPTALNTGIAAGQAPYVARQDADDRSLPGRLAAEAAHLEAEPGVGLVATAFEVVVGTRVVATMGPPPVGVLDRNPFCAGSTMVRRSVLEEAGGYRAAFRLSSDYDAWLRCAWHSGVTVLPMVGYRYRLTASMSTVARAGAQATFADLARASARARIDGAPDPADEAVVTVEEDAEVAAWWAREFAALGARRDAWSCARRASVGMPWRRRLALACAILGKPAPQAVWQ
jgi:glycosyltransferase involved in cell wall biosynthesis